VFKASFISLHSCLQRETQILHIQATSLTHHQQPQNHLEEHHLVVVQNAICIHWIRLPTHEHPAAATNQRTKRPADKHQIRGASPCATKMPMLPHERVNNHRYSTRRRRFVSLDAQAAFTFLFFSCWQAFMLARSFLFYPYMRSLWYHSNTHQFSAHINETRPPGFSCC